MHSTDFNIINHDDDDRIFDRDFETHINFVVK